VEKRLAVGILAHVDAGKTTLSEGLLYLSGEIRKIGRVDHGDAFLDTEALEKDRGITIFSKVAILPINDGFITLLDTPGHVDFSTEMERTLAVLDYAILVISAADGIQGHSVTLWRLLERHSVPTFIFVNKMDQPGADREALLKQLKREFSEQIVPFDPPDMEQVALCDEGLLEAFLRGDGVDKGHIGAVIARRGLFPVWFGSALRPEEGVAGLLEGLSDYTGMKPAPQEFGARVFKISRDEKGNRLTWMKVTGGALRAKTLLTGQRPGEEPWQEKADQLRLYSGAKFRPVDQAAPGTVVAVTGLTHTRPGDGLGFEEQQPAAELEPVLAYRLLLPEEVDPYGALGQLRQLEEEDPQLHLVWQPASRSIHLQLMGQVQLEVLRELIFQRFGWQVAFDAGSIVYRETIANTVEGIGHYEPLRHYAEVHLLLEPGERGSGIRLASACSEDELDRNWQRLIFTHLLERSHPGVLTGAALTDVKITLLAGRAHVKHTEGGDFRQATYRAVRQGLMGAQSVLLEPWYEFRLTVPNSCVGRAMNDIQRMNGTVEPVETGEEATVLAGAAPVAALRDYHLKVAAYAKGRGSLTCLPGGYRPCAEQEKLVAEAGYDPLRDVENPADSVFCAHGGGYNVPWDQVPQMAHIQLDFGLDREKEEEAQRPQRRSLSYEGGLAADKELQEIFERTYGKVEPRAFQPTKKPARTSLDDKKYTVPDAVEGPSYLLVDGYNVIYAWKELGKVAQESLEAARQLLMDLLSNFAAYTQEKVILVFDAYRVKGNPGSVARYQGIHVVYTKEAETADAYIEKATYELRKERRVRVVTSDGAEQLIILGHGALRVPAAAFQAEVEAVEGQMRDIIRRNNGRFRSQAVREAFERAGE